MTIISNLYSSNSNTLDKKPQKEINHFKQDTRELIFFMPNFCEHCLIYSVQIHHIKSNTSYQMQAYIPHAAVKTMWLIN